ncbi:MAG: hypothetical protein H0U65_11545 [Rubrobacter sp.]|nr:hypothetical protein [Rubrobacter sp.]
MRILLDEHLDWRLSRSFSEDFDVDTVGWRGWKGKKNGELLSLMESEGLDALITTDKGIPHQQRLSKYEVAVVRLRSKSTRLVHTAPLVEDAQQKIRAARPGEVTYLP